MADMLDDLYEDPQGDKSEEDYPSCPFLLKHAPLLHDFIRFDRYKGKPRKNGKVSFGCDGSHFVLSITDSDRQRSFTISCLGVQEGLQAIDQMISTKQIHWRNWGNPTPDEKPRKTGAKK
ncbi:unnamed protein product [marine sediment metagenome]|uniref:Uncharacterized protein n=1 Tax=marine sediment metagenome TaxID=412755 RepID=X1BNP8_9ZZZZ